MSHNRLGQETSPYLLQHRDNPVHWWPWGEAALEEAKRSGKPILLSVGYAACHWCHVMAHESFEDPATAEVMNELFINIKVDREERPDIDAIYMGALHRLGEQGGWPLTMFLDSSARPFWGGTYFPKQAQFGRPAFVTALLQISNVYHTEPDKVRGNADQLLQSLSDVAAKSPNTVVTEDMMRDLAQRIARAVDPEHGGLTGAPKFPQWNVFWFLWRAAIRFDDAAMKDAVIRTVRRIAQGGIYDHLGGGFARYSVDERWLVPHFEKMLYDNALLLDLMTEVWRETHDPMLARRVSETVDWLKREMIADGGGFAASLDADSEGEEGKFYVWSAGEIEEALGADDARFFADIYDVTPAGNFEGHTILNRLRRMSDLGELDEARLARLRSTLLALRNGRIRPGLDDKILADWNGLMIAALSRAAVVFDQPAWLTMAEGAFAFVSGRLRTADGRLKHSARGEVSNAPACASDYANMIWAALRLHQSTGEAGYLAQAEAWTSKFDEFYWDDADGGYRTSADDTADVIVRLKPAHDDAVPNANTIQLWNLLALHSITGQPHYAAKATDLVDAFASVVVASPVGHCGLLASMFDVGRLLKVEFEARGEDRRAAAMRHTLHSRSIPGALEFVTLLETPQVLQTSDEIQPTVRPKAIVCAGAACLAPIEDPAKLDAAIAAIIDVRAVNLQ